MADVSVAHLNRIDNPSPRPGAAQERIATALDKLEDCLLLARAGGVLCAADDMHKEASYEAIPPLLERIYVDIAAAKKALRQAQDEA